MANDASSNEKPFSDYIPADYKEKAYLKGVDSFDSLFKKLDSTQQVLNSRPYGLPQDTAPDDEWNQFFEKARPKEAKDYSFVDIEDMPDVLKRNEEDALKIKQMFHGAGLTKKQAMNLQKNMDMYFKDAFVNADKMSKEKLDSEFDSLMTETFGDKRDEKLQVAKDMLTTFTDEKNRPFIDQLDNRSLAIMATVLNAMKEKYDVQDSDISNRQGGNNVNSKNPRERISEIRKELSTFANESRHPEYANLTKEMDELYKKLG